MCRVKPTAAAASLLRTSHATCPRFPVPALPCCALPLRQFGPSSVQQRWEAREVLFRSTCTPAKSACQCTAGRRASNNLTVLPLFPFFFSLFHFFFLFFFFCFLSYFYLASDSLRSDFGSVVRCYIRSLLLLFVVFFGRERLVWMSRDRDLLLRRHDAPVGNAVRKAE